jgi:DNA-binding NtrC family response regulator
MLMTQPIRMLIADDSHIVQRLFLDAITQSGIAARISITDNGRDCLTLLQSHEIDLAFIDVHMPELSGMDAFWAARKLGVQTFVTVMSSPPSPEAMEFARNSKAYEFLFKPFKAADVLGIIKTYQRITAPTKVLIVDDSHTVRQIIQKTIGDTMFNCQIAEAPDGQTAIDMCATATFDAAFLDCNMPGLSGLETLQQLRVIAPDMKVVMISSAHDAVRDVRARKSGAHGFLAKPFNSGDVDRVLHDIHGLRSPNLLLQRTEPDFDVAIEGSTIRLRHNGSGSVFEYLWFKDAPHLRNATVRPAPSAEAGRLAANAERAALHQLNAANLVEAA